MDADIYSGFVRQRRNLIVMSMVVLLSEVANLRVEKISFFGNEATIGNPALVNTVLWVLLIYWLIRYYQYFHDLGDKNFLSSLMTKRKQLVKKLFFRNLLNDPVFIKSLPNDVAGKKYKAFPREVLFFQERWFSTSGNVEYLIGRDSGQGMVESEKMTIKGLDLFFPTLISFLHVFFRTRYFSEYILPFVLFTLPLFFSYPKNQSWLMSLINP